MQPIPLCERKNSAINGNDHECGKNVDVRAERMPSGKYGLKGGPSVFFGSVLTDFCCDFDRILHQF